MDVDLSTASVSNLPWVSVCVYKCLCVSFSPCTDGVCIVTFVLGLFERAAIWLAVTIILHQSAESIPQQRLCSLKPTTRGDSWRIVCAFGACCVAESVCPRARGSFSILLACHGPAKCVFGPENTRVLFARVAIKALIVRSRGILFHR